LRTTFVNLKTGLEIADQKKILINYITSGRIFIDLPASIPFEQIISAARKNSKNISSTKYKLFGLLKLVRLLRLGRIIRYLKFRQGFKLGFRLL
jgi:hypothetical protein